jgi:hypothetical protein
MALLTLAQQNQIKEIRTNWANTAKVMGGATNFERLQDEIENLEMRKLLGAAFLLDIQKNPGNYTNLLDGLEFKDCNDDTIEFKGIRFQLAYMNHAQYLTDSGNEETYTGLIEKARNESTKAPTGTLKNTAQRSKEIALEDFNLMKIYLDDNAENFPLWHCNTSTNLYKPKISFLKKTHR